MKDFAKSIRTTNSNVGNALKYTNLEEAKKMCQQMNDSLAPDAALRHYRHVYEKDGVYYVMETGEATAKGMKRVGNSKVGNAQKLYSDSNVTIYDDGIVELDYFRGYTQYAKDVESIVRDEIRGLENQISYLKKAADKVKEIGRKYKLL